MNELARQLTFDYSALPEVIRTSLRIRADKIIAVRNRAIYEIGKELADAQTELSEHRNGCFGQWVLSLGISRQHAYDLIGLYKNAGDSIVKLLDNKQMSQTVALFLCRESTPEPVIAAAVAKSEAGEHVSIEEVKRLKAEYSEKLRAAEETAKADRMKMYDAMAEAQKLKSQPAQVVEIVKETVPADYEQAKAKAAEASVALEKAKADLAAAKKKHDEAVKSGVAEQMRFRQKEVQDLDSKRISLEKRVAELAAYHKQRHDLDAILKHNEKIRADFGHALDQLSIELIELDFVEDERDRRAWESLILITEQAAQAIRAVAICGHKPALEASIAKYGGAA